MLLCNSPKYLLTWYYYFPHFIDEEIKVQRVNSLEGFRGSSSKSRLVLWRTTPEVGLQHCAVLHGVGGGDDEDGDADEFPVVDRELS